MSRIRDRIEAAGSADLASRLTLLALLLHPVGNASIRFWILGLAGAGLLIPNLFRRPLLWGGLAILTGSRVVSDWPLSDNHAFLLSYWCLAIALSWFVEDRDRFLAILGRWLIALVFAFSTLWKLVLAPDFVDGTFFRVTLLVDPRFESFTRLAGGLSIEQIESARSAIERHIDGGTLEVVAAAMPSVRFERLALAITAWTLAIEFALAVTFGWWRGRGVSRLGDGLLILFCASTYAVATVEGFGWLLISMGIAQSESGHMRTRIAFLSTFVLILVYREVPWLTWIANGVARI